MNNSTKAHIVILAGFQRNGAAMISHSFTEILGVSHLGEIFATDIRPTTELLHPDMGWRLSIYRNLFGMDRMPICLKPIVRNVQCMATPHHCNMVFDAIVKGDTQSELNYHLNTDDRIIFGKVAFEHCPYYYDTWQHMLSNNKCKLIWVHRKNPLHMIISGANANKQKIWQVAKGVTAPCASVHIDIQHLYQYLSFYAAHISFFTMFLKDKKNALILKYNQLMENWDETVKDICVFLNLEEQEVPIAIERQIHNHLQLVDNMDEVEKALKDSSWNWCLDE